MIGAVCRPNLGRASPAERREAMSNTTNRNNGNSNKQPPDVNYRDAKSGQYVTERYAKNHPATTVREHDRKK
jgi:hypothetical protein